jgi:DNA invertase Pin-like site-specific DNA recombinase
MNKYAIYLRVSTQKQGKSRLGLDAQKRMCEEYVTQEKGKIVAEYKDVESGTHRNRKGLLDAIAFCKANDCGLVIAKLDRLARDVEFCFRVVNTGVDIHFCDMPQMNTLLLGVFASVAQYERELTSDRTRRALEVKKAQGCKLGGASEAYRENYERKSEAKKASEAKQRGVTKNQRHKDSRDVQAFVRVLRNIYTDVTKAENPARWRWDRISLRGNYKKQVLAMMKDYKELDESGNLFASWDFADEEKSIRKLRSYMQATQKSFTC